MGEPLINGNYKWESATIQNLDSITVVWLTIQNSSNGTAFIRLNSTVPNRGEWSFNVGESPNWNTALAASWSGDQVNKFVSADIAKQFRQNGFQVVNTQLSRGYNN